MNLMVSNGVNRRQVLQTGIGVATSAMLPAVNIPIQGSVIAAASPVIKIMDAYFDRFEQINKITASIEKNQDPIKLFSFELRPQIQFQKFKKLSDLAADSSISLEEVKKQIQSLFSSMILQSTHNSELPKKLFEIEASEEKLENYSKKLFNILEETIPLRRKIISNKWGGGGMELEHKLVSFISMLAASDNISSSQAYNFVSKYIEKLIDNDTSLNGNLMTENPDRRKLIETLSVN